MNFVFKEVKTTSMKAAGILDADNMITCFPAILGLILSGN